MEMAEITVSGDAEVSRVYFWVALDDTMTIYPIQKWLPENWKCMSYWNKLIQPPPPTLCERKPLRAHNIKKICVEARTGIGWAIVKVPEARFQDVDKLDRAIELEDLFNYMANELPPGMLFNDMHDAQLASNRAFRSAAEAMLARPRWVDVPPE